MVSSMMRYLMVTVGAFLGIYMLITVTKTDTLALANFRDRLWGEGAPRRELTPTYNSDRPELANVKREKAAFVILARNSDVWEVLKSMRQSEDRFNKKYGYPYVFLNEEPFDETFKANTQALTDSPCFYGLIPKEEWVQPSWIDETKATKAREVMIEKNVIYGFSVPYRNMCRYNSGYFWRHPLLDQYDYYWRIEPSVDFFCDLDYDPFTVMRENNLNYGFTISLYEYIETIETLWDTVKAFMKEYPHLIPAENGMRFLSDDGGETYNRCHFWSNFEIGRLELWRSEAYRTFFDYLDKAGGFYYERWGDAPVHSIGAALFSKPEQIYHFNDIGYRHNPFIHCPVGEKFMGKCHCNPSENFDREWYSCLDRYDKMLEK